MAGLSAMVCLHGLWLDICSFRVVVVRSLFMYPSFSLSGCKELHALEGEAARLPPLNCAWSIGDCQAFWYDLAAAVSCSLTKTARGNAILDRWTAAVRSSPPYVDTYRLAASCFCASGRRFSILPSCEQGAGISSNLYGRRSFALTEQGSNARACDCHSECGFAVGSPWCEELALAVLPFLSLSGFTSTCREFSTC